MDRRNLAEQGTFKIGSDPSGDNVRNKDAR